MEALQIITYTPQQFEEIISKTVNEILEKYLKSFQPTQPEEYLTRKDVAQLLKVDLSTIANWNKSGKLKPLGIGGRVYYLKSDVINSLQPLKV